MTDSDQMAEQEYWDQRYRDGELPWDTGRPDIYLTDLIGTWPPCRGKVLEIGCGTGTNAVWLAGQGFDVTGIDIARQAVEVAEKRSRQAGVVCEFVCDNFLTSPLSSNTYIFAFDRGCFHAISDMAGRRRFVRRVAQCLQSAGIWFSLIGNPDDGQDDGPPRLTAREIALLVEEHFEILRLSSGLIESRREVSPRFWQCLLRKRPH